LAKSSPDKQSLKNTKTAFYSKETVACRGENRQLKRHETNVKEDATKYLPTISVKNKTVFYLRGCDQERGNAIPRFS
jgi:hypothetical protein